MKRYAALSATLIFAAILSQITPAEAQNIPAPSGRYSIARHGSLVPGALLGEARDTSSTVYVSPQIICKFYSVITNPK
jgi:hypothetical protein